MNLFSKLTLTGVFAPVMKHVGLNILEEKQLLNHIIFLNKFS
ncbi:protein of unknown function [Xenorhabdus doucetiae]|uniref:Uncharacterized protein n=1 Tax=Xenorhabdus doucetiae TaxID=351671 RepID=A0A068QSY0_9GAMM|nr:protein of unknown function [Xenorhabdus doucetiae]